jgi:hypothetical protein
MDLFFGLLHGMKWVIIDSSIRLDQTVNIVIPVVETYRNRTPSTETSKSELEAVLMDESFRKKFLKFCEQSFNPENVLCW